MADLIKYLSLAGLLTYDAKLKEYIGNLLEATDGNVSAVEALVNTLIGDDNNKSVRTIANEELAKQLVPENAKEALDTLEEIAAWIQLHPDDAAAMNAAIQANADAIGADAVEEVSHEATEEDVEAGKAEQVGDKVVDVAAKAASGLTARVADVEAELEALSGGAGSIKNQIDAAIDALAGSATGSDAVAETPAEGVEGEEGYVPAVPGKAAKVTVKVDSENGEVSAVTVTTNDIASAAELAALTAEVGDDDTEATVKGRIKALEDLFGEGEGSVSDQIQDAIDAITGTLAEDDAATLEAVNDKIDALASTAVESTDSYEGGAYKEGDEKPSVTVTLGGTVDAPTVSVSHNIDTVTEEDIEKLFAEETEESTTPSTPEEGNDEGAELPQA